MHTKIITLLVSGMILFGLQLKACSYELLYDNVPENHIKAVNFSPKTYTPASLEDGASTVFKGKKKPEYRSVIYTDKAFHGKENKSGEKIKYEPKLFTEKAVPDSEALREFQRPVYTGIINPDSDVPVFVRPDENYKTTTVYKSVKIEERYYPLTSEEPLAGTKLFFTTAYNVYKDGEIIIAKNTPVTGYVSFTQGIGTSGGEGTIAVNRFKTNDINGNTVNLYGEIEEVGLNTAKFTNTIAYCAIPFTFGTSIFLTLMPGTNGTIKTKKVYKLYYKPETKQL